MVSFHSMTSDLRVYTVGWGERSKSSWNLQHWFGDHGLKVNMSWYSDLCHHGPVILFYIWKPFWHMNIISPDYEMVWPDNSPQCECTSLWPIFHGPVILPYIWKPIWHINIISPDYEMGWGEREARVDNLAPAGGVCASQGTFSSS